MRFKDSVEQRLYLHQSAADNKLERVFQGLDVLSSTPWQINKDVFEVVLKVWNSGEAFGKIPPIKSSTPDPVKPDNYATDIKAKAAYMLAMQQATAEKRNNHSERCSLNYKVEIARAVCNHFFLRTEHVANPLVIFSSWVKNSSFLTTWISEDAHTLFPRILVKLGMISVVVYSSSQKLNLWVLRVCDG